MTPLEFVPIVYHGMSFLSAIFFAFCSIAFLVGMSKINSIDSRCTETDKAVANIDKRVASIGTSVEGIEKSLDSIVQDIRSTFSEGTESYVKIITAVLDERRDASK